MFESQSVVVVFIEGLPPIIQRVGKHTKGVQLTMNVKGASHDVLWSQVVQLRICGEAPLRIELFEMESGLQKERYNGQIIPQEVSHAHVH